MSHNSLPWIPVADLHRYMKISPLKIAGFGYKLASMMPSMHAYDRWLLEEQYKATFMQIRKVHNEWHVTVDNAKEKIEWCRETFGEGGSKPKYRWTATWLDLTEHNKLLTMRNTITLKFRDKEAIALFKLRWIE